MVMDNEKDTMVSTPLPPELNNNTDESSILPDNDQSTTAGCRKPSNISLFFETTAGMLALIRPCGIVVSMTEMYTKESCTQVLLFLLRTFCGDVEDLKRLRYLGYDRACGLVPFLRNQAKSGSAGAKVLLENVQFLVDIFHVEKHTERVCMPLQNNPEGEYHPHLPKFHAMKKHKHGILRTGIQKTEHVWAADQENDTV